MNRILIGSSNKKIGVLKDSKLIIDINKDTNILIENSNVKSYTFNVIDAKVNILNVEEKANDITYDININKGNVSFNSINYDKGNFTLNINLNKKDSSVTVYNSVIAKDFVNYDIKVNHNEKNTNSEIYNNGITIDNGTIYFDVYSYAPKGSKECLINQDSKIISLNEKNDNKINPVLLIDEFETEARHAAFIGNFKEEELFYLMSRGLNVDKAKNLLINGLLIGCLDICFNEKENLKKKLNDEWR